ncbi:MAG: PTS sugar transporter subunit IIA [SAR324 cluster bacterium]|nr:PTS sugar transporter subunit IIA [SAR324 cluster bacterium]
MSATDLTVREAARVLKVSEKTIYRWIRQGVLPTFKVQGQYRFDGPELDAWARYKRIGGSEAATGGEQGEESANLLEAVRRGGIHYKIEGEHPEQIFRNVVSFFPFAANFKQEALDALVEALLEREMLVSTGIGNGIALPHPRQPRDWGLGAPMAGVFFLEKPADFKAFDGQRVYALFVLLCSTIKGHLRMLSQVSHLLNDSAMRKFLSSHPSRTKLLQRIESGLAKPPDRKRD